MDVEISQKLNSGYKINKHVNAGKMSCVIKKASGLPLGKFKRYHLKIWYGIKKGGKKKICDNFTEFFDII